MKNWIVLLAFFVAVDASAKNIKVEQKVAQVATALEQVATGVEVLEFTPGLSVHDALLEIALKSGYSEDVEEFESNWMGNGDAWGADEMDWGSEALEGAQDYISGNIKYYHEEGYDEDETEEQYQAKLAIASKAFAVLKGLPTVKYGVAPMGAIQCGVTLAALIILDIENGKAYKITMESGGC